MPRLAFPVAKAEPTVYHFLRPPQATCLETDILFPESNTLLPAELGGSEKSTVSLPMIPNARLRQGLTVNEGWPFSKVQLFALALNSKPERENARLLLERLRQH
jgi:hypothetical protein